VPLLLYVMFLLISSQTDVPLLLRYQSAKFVQAFALVFVGAGRAPFCGLPHPWGFWLG
jgi:hypothetical protein